MQGYGKHIRENNVLSYSPFFLIGTRGIAKYLQCNELTYLEHVRDGRTGAVSANMPTVVGGGDGRFRALRPRKYYACKSLKSGVSSIL
jgi:hypothetical protein